MIEDKQVSMDRDTFAEAIAPILKEAGFKKDRLNWRRDYPETIAVFNIQSSQWGPEYYLNLGIYLKTLGSEQRPTENRCHLRKRMEPDDDVEKLARQIIRWLSKNSTEEGMHRTIAENQGILAAVALKNYLGIDL